MKYDYLIVGSGLFGSVFAHEMTKKGKKCLIIEKRDTIGGNIYTEKQENINVHKYGAHIFHTSDDDIWNYVNQFIKFNRFTNSPIANYKGELYNLPFNMNTFYKLWKTKTPQEAYEMIESEKEEYKTEDPQNLEEQAINLVGPTIYEKLIKGYTEKQWGKPCDQLPSFIIKRLPVRFTYDNNYFNDLYQGIPFNGYTELIEKLTDGIDIKLNTNYFDDKQKWDEIADKVLFTGMIDEYYDYCYGELEYRGLNFESETLDIPNYQGNAVINYTEAQIPYTRIIEHKHFENSESDKTIITREYPKTWTKGEEAYYPVNDDKNSQLYAKYKDLADKEDKIIFGGRLGMYKYMNMDEVIKEALNLAEAQ
ncbi:UDP-galactopyranose mutase [Methanosphaera cuniculi]|jgi:UDP-galactopyranose mutase|uniref:UDP-galactopyranose mutase n=1 Tax=Methanosphaera cuniculi TaxID=1077256 RepID=A0A2A2HC69_9EURY|nr:UDP-galactopyranose mutase [Methanosphaera cuniculi]PAV06920.1 UDP-galactopyranose mutase [Methanosphaera cuniculi]PWL08686.1 UDP-galactopyranose mutase [Methanosphaera cuniculi]